MKFWEENLRYRRGCEEDAGDWNPTLISDSIATAVDRIGHLFELNPDCESPIEVQLGAAILMFFQRARLPRPNLQPQFRWTYYRSDLAITAANGRTLLIECDGRDFHSSPEQLAHDSAKDKAAKLWGFRTIRFSGSQIHRDPDGCARKVFDAMCAL